MASRPVSTQTVNEQSFTDLLVPVVQPAYRLACALLHDPQAAEDVVQEASLIAWRKLDRLDDQGRLKAWFLGIVANECRNARRRRWTSAVRVGLPTELSVVSREERAVSRADLRHALRRLSRRCRLHRGGRDQRMKGLAAQRAREQDSVGPVTTGRSGWQ